jgi:hypothetical protein
MSMTRELTADVVGKMINEGKFHMMRKLNVQLRNKLSEIEILLDLNETQKHPISGFPRCLYDDEKDVISMQARVVSDRLQLTHY